MLKPTILPDALLDQLKTNRSADIEGNLLLSEEHDELVSGDFVGN